MSYESTAEPIKVGYLDGLHPAAGVSRRNCWRRSPARCFDLIFEEAVEQGLMDRPVQMIYREVEGLPEGFGQGGDRRVCASLVDEGCLVVFGPEHHRQLRADARGDRGALQGACASV